MQTSVSNVKGDENFIQALVPHVSRISHLALTGYSSIEDVANNLPGIFASPLSGLTSLELEQTNEPTKPFPPNEDATPPLFQNISKLRSLHLTRTPLYPTVFSFTSLIELTLAGYTAPFHFGKFIEFLRSNPDLELVILNLQFAEDSMEITPERKVSLSRLRRLEIACVSAADARELLLHTSLPRGVHIAIQGFQSACADLAEYLPCPPTPIQQLLTPITAIQYRNSPR